jgi:redox-sensitive bicupin YhaK (pirin superfamily)
VVGPEGGEVVEVHQQASVHVAALDPGVEVEHSFGPDRAGYLYLIGGEARLDGDRLGTGDAVKAYGPDRIGLEAVEPTELILVDVPRDYARVGVWAR